MTQKNWRIHGLIILMLAAVQAGRADQVTLKNGDRVTGAIIKKDGETLTIKTEALGTVTIPWEQVAALSSDAPLNVVLPDGRTVQSTLQTSEGKVELRETRQAITPADVVTIRNADEQAAYERLINPGLIDLWAGAASIGFTGTQGNAETRTFTVSVNSARRTTTDTTSLYFKAIKASALIEQDDPVTGERVGIEAGTAQAVRGGWAYDRTVSSRFFVNTFNDYEYDRFQDLDLRFVLGGGLGYHAWTGERGRLELVGGAAYNREKFGPVDAAAFSRNSAEAYWGEDLNYRLTGTTALVQAFRMFNNLSDTGEFRMNFDVGANTRLFRWLTWNLGLSDRYLSNPVSGRLNNDFQYTIGLGITFAH